MGIIFLILSFSLTALSKNYLIKICIIAFLITGFLSELYFNILFFPPETKDEEIEAEVITISEQSNFNVILAEVNKIGEEDTRDYRILIYDYSKNSKLVSGNCIKFNGNIIPSNADEEVSSYNIAKGISGTVFQSGGIKKISEGKEHLSALFTRYRYNITNYIVSLCGDSAGGLLSALLLGDKSHMDPDLNLSFKVTGISHILALSGMHLTILCGALYIILSLFKIDKRLSVLINSLFCIGFMLLTGMPSSIMRAGLMFLLASALYLLFGCKDSITNLFISVFIIIAIQPYSVFDIGLWLSAIATLGILIGINMLDRPYEKEKSISKFLKGLLFSLYYSIFAISATLLICVFVFDGISWLGGICTLVFGILTELYIYIGFCVLAIGAIFPQVGAILTPFYTFIYDLANFFSELPLSYTSSNFIAVKILAIAVTAFMMIIIFVRLKNKKLITAILFILLISVYTVSVLGSVIQSHDDNIIYSSEDADRFILRSDGEITLVEFSSLDSSDYFNSTKFLTRNNLCKIDNYVILNYSSSMRGTLTDTVRSLMADKVYIPLPKSEYEDKIATTLYDELSALKKDVIFYSDNEEIKVGSFKILLFDRIYTTEANACAAIFRYENKIFGYMSSGALELFPKASTMLYATDYLIFGGFGSDYKVEPYIYEISQYIETVILADDNIFFKDNSVDDNTQVIDFYSDIFLLD